MTIVINRDKIEQLKKNKEIEELTNQNADMLLEIAMLRVETNIKVKNVYSYRISPWFDRIKSFYDKGIYNKEDLLIFINAGMITVEEYEQINAEELR